MQVFVFQNHLKETTLPEQSTRSTSLMPLKLSLLRWGPDNALTWYFFLVFPKTEQDKLVSLLSLISTVMPDTACKEGPELNPASQTHH